MDFTFRSCSAYSYPAASVRPCGSWWAAWVIINNGNDIMISYYHDSHHQYKYLCLNWFSFAKKSDFTIIVWSCEVKMWKISKFYEINSVFSTVFCNLQILSLNLIIFGMSSQETFLEFGPVIFTLIPASIGTLGRWGNVRWLENSRQTCSRCLQSIPLKLFSIIQNFLSFFVANSRHNNFLSEEYPDIFSSSWFILKYSSSWIQNHMNFKIFLSSWYPFEMIFHPLPVF